MWVMDIVNFIKGEAGTKGRLRQQQRCSALPFSQKTMASLRNRSGFTEGYIICWFNNINSVSEKLEQVCNIATG
jgi:hypothetical protein